MGRRMRAFLISLTGLALVLGGTGQVTAASAPSPTYTNPATGDYGTAAPDPAVIRGRDGYWYAYTTVAKLPGKSTRNQLPILRSRDLTTWEYVGDVFTEGENWPTWSNPRKPLWAPDINYYNGRYYLYYSVVDSPEFEQPNASIGVATAPTPAGPWTDAGRPIVEPRWWEPFPGGRRHMSVIDAEVVTAPDGSRYLYYGGFQGGIFAVRLSPDGLTTVGEATQVVSEFRLEGAYVVHRDGFYYLFGSAAGCCSGPVTGYTVYAGRSTDPMGPFIDEHGTPLVSPRPGGTPVLAPNGNRWVGTGHNAIATDLSGRDWIVYHAYDRHDPYLGPPVPHNRQLLLDRLDWVDGWPVTRAGEFASDSPQDAPVVDTLVADAFEDRELSATWLPTPGWQSAKEAAGGFVRAGDAAQPLHAERAVAGDIRARAAVRLARDGSAAGLVLADHDDGGRITVEIDAAARELAVSARRAGKAPVRDTAALPESFAYDDWHELSVEIRGGRLTAKVSDAGLYDPVARAEIRLPRGLDGGPFGLIADDGAAFDDVTVAPLHEPVTTKRPNPEPGTLDPAYSDDFDGDAIGPEWSWIRSPAASVRDGALEFPLQDGGFYRLNNDTSLLVRDVPQTEWTVETKLELEFGTENLAGFPQAGLFAYINDDHYVRLTKVGHGEQRRNALLKEMPYEGGLEAGEAWIGPPGEHSTYLRLRHTLDPDANEHVLRAGTSPNGDEWTWGAAYTLPANANVRLALSAFSDVSDHTAYFDYVRLYRP